MSILKVTQMGHPVLRRVADSVLPGIIRSEDFQRQIRDMQETMVEYQGIGLAAPQVHVSARLLVYRADSDDGAESEILTLVNPVIEPLGDETEPGWEGCLSIPDIRGIVPRHRRIRVTSLDEEGEALEYTAEDFEARVIQHEVDHLDGILYFDRMDDLRTLTYQTEQEMYWIQPEVEDEDA